MIIDRGLERPVEFLKRRKRGGSGQGKPFRSIYLVFPLSMFGGRIASRRFGPNRVREGKKKNVYRRLSVGNKWLPPFFLSGLSVPAKVSRVRECTQCVP